MAKPASIKLKRDEGIELKLGKGRRRPNKMVHLYLDASKVGGENFIGRTGDKNHASIYSWWASRCSVAVTYSKDACTVVVRVEK